MTSLYTSRGQAVRAAEKLKAYAQPQRLMILSRLLQGECNVGQLDAATAVGQPALSQQLAELRRAGLVLARRESKEMHYRLANESVAACVRNVEAMFAGPTESATRLAAAAKTSPRSPRPGSAGAAVFATIEREPKIAGRATRGGQ